MKKYCVIDLETSGTTTHKRFCNPLDPRHSITLVGSKLQGEEAVVALNGDCYEEGIARARATRSLPLGSINTLVGQNIKFDLLWIWPDKYFQWWLTENGGCIWDTITVEYLLRGQQGRSYGTSSGSLSLDALATSYGGQVKDNRVTTMFQTGTLAKDIHPSILIPYLEQDLINTNIVLQGQLKKLSSQQHMIPLLRAYMNHYLATVEMEYNGMYFNVEEAKKRIEIVQSAQNIKSELLRTLIPTKWPEQVVFNPSSIEHISAILFGGTVKEVLPCEILDDKGQVLHYKTGARKGEIKTRKEKVEFAIEGAGLTPNWANQTKKGFYKTDEAVLQELIADAPTEQCREFCSVLLEYREQAKLLGTYLEGFVPLVHPDGCIHGEFKTALTKTGRLASRNPNIQNLHPGILDLFCSRWRDEGVILEFDYNQLEVVVQAYLSQSSKFIQDIKDGVDFHCKRLAYAEDMPYDEVVALCATSDEWKAKRKKAKIISFQKAYGARPQKIAESSGLPLEVVEEVFRREDVEYPEIQEFYDEVLQTVQRSRKPLPDLIQIKNKKTGEYFTREGEYQAIGQYTSITGKLYTFHERAVLTKRGDVFRYWSIPDIQDYPVQGTAADIVALQVGKVYRALADHRDKALIVNEVHDSLILDVKKEHLDLTIELVRGILEDVANSFKLHLGIEFNVPIKVDYCYGTTWADAKNGEEI